MEACYDTLLVDLKDRVATVRMNRDESRNALEYQLRVDLADCFKSFSEQDDIRAVILTGSKNAFNAGGDLKELRRGLTVDGARKYLLHASRIVLAIRNLESTRVPGVKAYEEAGIKNPREEINLMELHDCFSISELITYESLQISPIGKARVDVEDGFYDFDGKIACQSDGGLKCFGHPIGASGIRMVYEIYKQLQGKAEPEERQLKTNPRLGLTHNHGGICGSLVCSVAIFGSEL